MYDQLTLVAHRGYSSEAPENTLAAFDLAIAHGVFHIELDVQLSHDAVPVVIHDETLNRTTTGCGQVRDRTFRELKTLDAGNWFNADYAGQQIPSLEEILNRYRSADLHIELKSEEPELPEIVSSMLIDSGWVSDTPGSATTKPRLFISSYLRDQLLLSRKFLPRHIVHELLVEQVSDESMLWAANFGAHSYHPDGNDVTPELVKKARDLNLEVGAWWWTREEQDPHKVGRAGARYAFVDTPTKLRYPKTM
jgi:glycerophosphoryl diester phosphodiesterase